MSKRRTLIAGFVCLLMGQFGTTFSQVEPPIEVGTERAAIETLLQRFRPGAIKEWDADIRRLEELDRKVADPNDGILFIGSSSIRRWDAIARDMAPYFPIKRGYGGARNSDLAVFAKRLIHPHQYRAMVMFVANDVRGKDDDLSPDETEALVRSIVQVAQDHRPNSPVLIVEVTPTERRIGSWPKIRKSNQRLREIAFTTPNCFFIPTAEHYLDSNDLPRAEFFVDDKLHLNDSGYRLWGKLIRRRLDEVLRLQAAEQRVDGS